MCDIYFLNNFSSPKPVLNPFAETYRVKPKVKTEISCENKL